jgi:hypothetical protein
MMGNADDSNGVFGVAVHRDFQLEIRNN